MGNYTIDVTGDTLFSDTKYMFFAHAGTADEPRRATVFVPRPRRAVSLTVSACDFSPRGWHKWTDACTFLAPQYLDRQPMRPADTPATPYKVLRRAADPHAAINLAIVAEGYTANEMGQFLADAQRADSAFFSHDIFARNADRFNVVAVMLESAESGISRPSKGIERQSALSASFDSFNLDRLITIPTTQPLWDALEGIPFQQVIVLVNSDQYGGSGSYNEYCIGTARDPWSPQILVHEFGHCFANLADEYESGYSDEYRPDFEPEEPNITTRVDFSSKWADMMEHGDASLIEGAGYQEKGVWRAYPHCLMRSLGDRKFCPVCERAMQRTIDYYTRQLPW